MSDQSHDICFFPGMEVKGIGQISLSRMNHNGAALAPASGKIIGLYRAFERHPSSGHMMPTLWAIVALSTDERVAALEAEVVRLQEAVQDARTRLDAEVKRYVDASNAASSWNKACDELRDKNRAISDSRDNAVRTWNKLEEDLAKVRKFFGEKAFNEALEAK